MSALKKGSEMADVRDILELERPPTPEITRELILGAEKQKKKPGVLKPVTQKILKRPEGMHREVFALLYNDKNDAPPILPTDTGYKQTKAKLGMRKVRPWAWTPFTNPARNDNAVFHHWRRVTDEPKEYPFAKFNKQVSVPSYTNAEYSSHLTSESWTKEETDALMDLAKRFDLRFIVMQDRWNLDSFKPRGVEDLKERYYEVCGILDRVRGSDKKIYVFDADHERRRKDQLDKQFKRTTKQLEEEQMLLNELKKIEARKKERERKTQDLQKLISQADGHSESHRKTDKKMPKKKLHNTSRPSRLDPTTVELVGIKFPDFKNSGVSLRSQRIKLPANVGQKKSKAIEQMLQELKVDPNPTPTEEICQQFNELRNDIVLNYELKSAISTCEFELQSLRHQYEALNPGRTLTIPAAISGRTEQDGIKQEIIDVVGSPSASSNG